MKKLTSNQVRKMWLDFFESKGHRLEESASLIPNDDPTLLWINAGVAALKKYFDGSEKPINSRIANSQKCIRTNDIENVGVTARHQTLFEMLGTFSIGDYFRKEAILFAVELLLDKKWFNIDKNLLYITVYPQDKETYDLWLEAGIEESHLIKSNYNFWEIGEGPCGPCTEIFYDRGVAYGDCDKRVIEDDIENDRYIEIWNIVFSQYNSIKGLARKDYPELPQKNIDTGAGLERIVCLSQNVETNFETDLFYPIIQEVERLSGVQYTGQIAFKVITDHVRTVTFAVADGAILSNEGRGYVLRRILRRAIKFARTLGFNKPFMYNLVDIVIENMGEYYRYLDEKRSIIKTVIKTEEEKFFETLEKGLKMFLNIEGDISGVEAFTLYDTYGFPIELTLEYAAENNKKVDLERFKEEMNKQKERARNARGKSSSMTNQNEKFLNFKQKFEFVGYDNLENNCLITGVFTEGVVFDKTSFYATSGGQVGDVGVFESENCNFDIIGCNKMPNGQFIHQIENLKGELKVGLSGKAKVDSTVRQLITCNHSATHLLFKVLREQLGNHVSQAGSQVTKDNLRFDFNNYHPLTRAEILTIEEKVNLAISRGMKVTISNESISRAKEMGAVAEFGEKYGDLVRVVNIDNFTIDLCGGTHVKSSSQIKKLAITSVESKGSGVYRMEALTNRGVDSIGEFLQVYNDELNSLITKANKIVAMAEEQKVNIGFNYQINENYSGSYQDVLNKRDELVSLKEKVKNLDREVKRELEKLSLNDLSTFDQFIEGNSLIAKVEGYDQAVLKQIVDSLLDKLGTGFVFLANVVDDKIIFVSKSNNDVHCGKIVKEAAIICGGNGGGKPTIAQAGGRDITKIDQAIKRVKELIK